MKDKHFTSRMLTSAGALMSISGILIAICAKLAYGGILFTSAACMFFAARNFRIAEDRNDKDTQMNMTYEHKPAMTFIGFSTSIRPEEGYQKCPEFWDKAYAQKYARLWQTMQPETPVEKAILENGVGLFAICDEKKGSFEYWIAGLYQGGQVPEGLKLYTFPESDWAMFSAKGPLPGSLQSLNTQIWQEWYPNEGQKYRGNGSAMLEVYSPGDMQSPDYECGIWVPIYKSIGQSEHEAAEIVSTMMITGIL